MSEEPVLAGSWVRRLRRLLDLRRIDLGLPAVPGWDAASDVWDDAARRLTVLVRRAAHIDAPAGSDPGLVDGRLRRYLLGALRRSPRIVDVRTDAAKRAHEFAINDAFEPDTRDLDGVFLTGHYTDDHHTAQQNADIHATTDGLSDRTLPYHLYVERDGLLWVVNDASLITWHAKGLNFKTVGIAFSGDKGGPTPQQVRTLEWAIPRLLAGTFGFGFPKLERMTTHGHARRIDPDLDTDCPGVLGEQMYQRIAGNRFVDDPRPFV